MGKDNPNTKTPANTINGSSRRHLAKVVIDGLLEEEFTGLPEYMELTKGHTIIVPFKLQTLVHQGFKVCGKKVAWQQKKSKSLHWPGFK
jgi:hypothetical protein